MTDENDPHKKPTVGFGSEPPKLFSPADNKDVTVSSHRDAVGEQRSPSLVGQTIQGKYKILELLEEGSLCQVYLAQHVLSGRQFAFKLLVPPKDENISQAQYLERFKALVEHQKSISHPNAIGIEDFGIHEFRGFIASEFVFGKTLEALLKEKQEFSSLQTASIITQVSDALAAYHSANIFHKDLNTANIFLVNDDDGERAVIINCGLTDILSRSDDSAVSDSGTVLGDPKYLSPEQVQGGQIDSRTDVYALGIITYELLAGKPPFHSENVMDLLIQQAKTAPKPPSHLSPERMIPTSVEAVVLKALAKSPEERYQSVVEFAENLRLSLEDMPQSPDETKPEWPELDPELFVEEDLQDSQVLSPEVLEPKKKCVRSIFLLLLFLSLGLAAAVVWQSMERLEEDAPLVVTLNKDTDTAIRGASSDTLTGVSEQVETEDSVPVQPEILETEPVIEIEEPLDADAETQDEPVSFDDPGAAVQPEEQAPFEEEDSQLREPEESVDQSVENALSQIAKIKEELDDFDEDLPVEEMTEPEYQPEPTPTAKQSKPPAVEEMEFLVPGWYVQVAAKEDAALSQSIGARLVEAELEVVYQRATVAGVMYNRVLVGPLATLEEAKAVKKRIMREKLHNEVPFIKKTQ